MLPEAALACWSMSGRFPRLSRNPASTSICFPMIRPGPDRYRQSRACRQAPKQGGSTDLHSLWRVQSFHNCDLALSAEFADTSRIFHLGSKERS